MKNTTIDNSSENDDDKPTHINNSNKGMLETVQEATKKQLNNYKGMAQKEIDKAKHKQEMKKEEQARQDRLNKLEAEK